MQTAAKIAGLLACSAPARAQGTSGPEVEAAQASGLIGPKHVTGT